MGAKLQGRPKPMMEAGLFYGRGASPRGRSRQGRSAAVWARESPRGGEGSCEGRVTAKEHGVGRQSPIIPESSSEDRNPMSDSRAKQICKSVPPSDPLGG